MAGSTYGNIFKITTWGESHGKAIGVVVDGCPAGLSLSEEDIQLYLNRRKPGQSELTTPRKEDDLVEILSGVFEGKTTGTPISLIVYNKDHHSADYSQISGCFRPGHADYTFDEKYGFRDYRGGGRSSGRETIGRVAAGAIACKLLNELGVSVQAYAKSMGDVLKAKNAGDSVGGIVECIVKGMPAGVGEPVFEKLDANLAKALMSIGAVKGVEIGDGFKVADSTGSYNNDSFIGTADGIKKATNHAGGILGGISDGSDIIIRAAFKPTPSITLPQNTVTKDGNEIQLSVTGRHDPVIVPRAVVVVEAMVALTILDMLFVSMTSKLDNIIDFFN